MEHRVVWENSHGPIPNGYSVHHKNGNKLDNDLENLELVDPLTHKRLHSGCILIDGEWHKPCGTCSKMKPVLEFYERHDGLCFECKKCTIARSIRDKRARLRAAIGMF